MHRWSPVVLAHETTAFMLLAHTVAIALYLAVSIILLKALILLRRTGERPTGFLAIAILILLTSLGRAVWLSMLWLNVLPPPWLDLSVLFLVYAGFMATPIVLSAFYLPADVEQGRRSGIRNWLHWGMIANALAGATILLWAFAYAGHSLILLGIPATFTLAAVLLCARIAALRSRQVRRHGLLLFAAFTSAGLLMVAAVFVYGGIHRILVRRSTGTSTLLEFSSLLILIGMLFVFANLRLADVIVKRVLRLALWMCAALGVWIGIGVFAHHLPLRAGVRPKAVRSLLSVALIALFGALTPASLRLLDLWIDRWIFQQPDFDAAVKMLWDRLIRRETEAGVFNEAENSLRKTLSLSDVRVTSIEESDNADAEPAERPGPRFVHASSMRSQTSSGTSDVLIPLFAEGSAAHWIVLSRSILRPPLTAMELAFAERVAAQVQVRLETLLAEERRIQNVRRETAFREELTDAELRALRAQINPHFLFNSLNTIADLTVTAPEHAEQMTLRLAAVFRYVLVNTEKQFASIKEEINFARSYLEIEEFRFGDRLRTSFDIDPQVLDERVPTLLLQPLIENALKHGLAPRRGGGTISIAARIMGDGLTLIVADDGVGLRGNGGSASSANTHVGLSNIRKRLATAYQGLASINLNPREGGGTEAIVVIQKGWRPV